MRNIAILAGLAACAAANAVITESESNNTIGTANLISRGASPWADVGVINLAAGGGDVDFFGIDLLAGEYLTVITYPIADDSENAPDTMLTLRDSTGFELDFNDDANGFGSAIRYHIADTGRYYIGITGFGDTGFGGAHGEEGDYILTVSVVPEPATMLALGAGLAALAARKRRK
ncbi:MAG: PEP-CTERM sorting domain-containing protein [Fimbriimonadales bacterium]